MSKTIKLSFTVILLILSASGLTKAQDVIRASGGTDLSIDLITSGQYVTIDGPTIRETAVGQLAENSTIVLTLPIGYEWNTALTGAEITLTITPTGAANTQLEASFSGFSNTQEALFTIDRASEAKGNGQGPGRIEILGLQIRPATTAVPDAGTISNTGTTGPDANYGNLSKVAGSINEVSVETAADGTGQVVPAQDILAGNSLTVYSIGRDIGGNFVENVALATANDWSLTNVTGNIPSTALDPAVNLRSAVFSSQLTGSTDIRASLSGATSVPSGTITVLPRDADQIVIDSQPPANAIAGEVFTNNLVIHVEDIFGNLVTTDNSTEATVSINNGNGTLSGTLTRTAVNGVITFNDLSADIANTIDLSVISSGLNSLTTSAIEVDHNIPAGLTYLVQPANTAQNQTITPPVEVQLVDTFGNIADTQGVIIDLSASVALDGSSTTSDTTDANGKGVFDNLIIGSTATLGNATLTVQNAGGTYSQVSDTFEIISLNSLAKFIVESGTDTPISEQTAGQPFDIRIEAINGLNEVYTDFTDTVRITSNSQITVNGNPVSGLSSLPFENGILNTTITLTTAGLSTISVENEALNRSGQSNEFNVLPGTLDPLTTLITANPTEILANGSSTSEITVQLRDEYFNNLLSGGETVEVFTDFGSFTGNTTTFNAVDQGDGTYTALLTSSQNASETATITAEVNSVSVPDNATVDFTQGEVAGFIIDLPSSGTGPDTQTAGVPFPIDVQAIDAYGNLVTDFDGNVTISSNSNITGGISASFLNGQLSAHDITLTQSNLTATLTITANDIFNVQTTSEEFVVKAAAPDPTTSVVVANPSVLQNLGTSESVISIVLRDVFNNKVLEQIPVSLDLTQVEENGGPSPDGNANASQSAPVWNVTQQNYIATLTATNTVELVEITGSFGDSPATLINQTATVDIVNPILWTAGATGPPENKTNWINPENWSPQRVPGEGDYVIIPGDVDPPVLDINPNIGSFEIQSGATFTLYGGNAITLSGALIVDGILDILDNTNISTQGGFTGSGTFTAGAQTNVSVGGDITVSSFLARNEGATITLNGDSPQSITTPNFLAQNLNIENDVTFSTGADLLDVNTLNIVSSNTFELQSGAGITLDVTQQITGQGTLLLNDNTFVLRGNASLENIDASDGTVIFGIRLAENFVDYPNLQQQQISNFTEMQNAIINNTEGVQTFDDILISGDLTLQNGPLILTSGNSLIAPNINYVNGTLRMLRNINASRGWRMISAPLQSNFDDFLDKTVTQGFTGSSLGNDPADSLQPNVLWYNTTFEVADSELGTTDNQRWRAPGNITETPVAGRGYFVYFFGDIAGDPRYNTPLPLSLDIEGTEYPAATGTFNFSDIAYNENSDGWNLVGNPFASSLDWDNPGWTKTNIDNVLYVWDPVTNDYFYWNGIGGGNLDGTKLGNGIIRPFQAFWVKANANNPVLSVDQSARTTGGTFLSKNNKEPEVIALELSSGEYSKPTHITLSPGGRTQKDDRDAIRLLPFETNTYLEFFTTLDDGTQLAINNLARDFGSDIQIPLHVGGFENGIPLNGSFTIKLHNLEELPQGWSITLKDKKTDQQVDLRDQETYTFDLTQQAGKAKMNTVQNFSLTHSTSGSKAKADLNSRFTLILSPGEDADGLPDQFELYNNYPNPFNPTTTIRFAVPIEGPVQLDVYDILGRKVTQLIDQNYQAGFHEVNWNAGSLASGIYIYRLSTEGGVLTKKMTLVK
ncbi:invasin domain 3-containing protein [Gracilimonas sp. Q87]|uniref:invasin domain 3-containing protein n=1 Tax=Gracilimonas sp. Q87 TaxID=3384766 RepID=UPI00398421CF